MQARRGGGLESSWRCVARRQYEWNTCTQGWRLGLASALLAVRHRFIFAEKIRVDDDEMELFRTHTRVTATCVKAAEGAATQGGARRWTHTQGALAAANGSMSGEHGGHSQTATWHMDVPRRRLRSHPGSPRHSRRRGLPVRSLWRHPLRRGDTEALSDPKTSDLQDTTCSHDAAGERSET